MRRGLHARARGACRADAPLAVGHGRRVRHGRISRVGHPPGIGCRAIRRLDKLRAWGCLVRAKPGNCASRVYSSLTHLVSWVAECLAENGKIAPPSITKNTGSSLYRGKLTQGGVIHLINLRRLIW